MERKITIEEHVLYKEDYQMKMLKANSPEGFLHVGGRGVNGSSYYDYDVSGKVSMQAMYARAKLKAEDIRHFMEQLGNVLKEAERYLLDIHCIRNTFSMKRADITFVIILWQNRIYGRSFIY